MNPSLLTHKFTWIVSLVAAVAAMFAVAAAAVSQYPTPMFLIAVTAALLVIMARDYAPRRRRWEPRLAAVRTPQAYAAQRWPLAS